MGSNFLTLMTHNSHPLVLTKSMPWRRIQCQVYQSTHERKKQLKWLKQNAFNQVQL